MLFLQNTIAFKLPASEIPVRDFNYKQEMKNSERNSQNSNFYKNIKPREKSQMLLVDLSQLTHRSVLHPRSQENKSPANFLAVDISALSHNPDPSLPVESNIGKYSIANFEKLDSQYDRPPVIQTEFEVSYPYVNAYKNSKSEKLFQMAQFPFFMIVPYYSMLNDRIDQNLKSNLETEKLQTANFIQQLLKYASSNPQLYKEN